MEEEERARAIWSDLVAGRSTVVDRFDDDRRLFLVVEIAEGPALLEPVIVAKVWHGHSNKRIAFELGLSESTVSAHVHAAIARLGAESLVDLARWPWGLE